MAGLDRDTLEMVLSTLREYAERKLTPEYLLELDYKDEFPMEVLKDLYNPEQLGLHLLFIPEEFGGLGGGAYDIYRVSETMARIDLGIATGVLATFLGTDPITVGGTPEQKQLWMGRIADEGLLVAYGATEPAAGSDLGSLTTKAEPVSENGTSAGYKITGRKQWISNGGVAALYTVLANAPGGPSWFVVERDTPGFTYGKPEDYLESFSDYLRQHSNDIPALLAVLQRPRELTRADLLKLAALLDHAGFNERALSSAWSQRTDEAVAAGIIGFIRQAALGDPLLPFERRVDMAITRIRQKHPEFTPLRLDWLNRLGRQLKQNDVLDREVINNGPLRSQGGFGRIDGLFDGKLQNLIEELNEAVWARQA